MKNLLFFASVCSLLVLTGCESTSSIPSQMATQTSISGYTMQNVQQHATTGDCRTVVDGKIYDMSSFASHHTGGPDSIISVCGKDGAATFTKHHNNQIALIQQYFVADLQK